MLTDQAQLPLIILPPVPAFAMAGSSSTASLQKRSIELEPVAPEVVLGAVAVAEQSVILGAVAEKGKPRDAKRRRKVKAITSTIGASTASTSAASASTVRYPWEVLENDEIFSRDPWAGYTDEQRDLMESVEGL